MSEYAYIHLSRLGGCNYKRKIVKRTQKSVMIPHPQQKDRLFRIDRKLFEMGESQFRDGWFISMWGYEAERRCASEANWQT